MSKDKIEVFLTELTDLTLKHGIYITTVLDDDGETKDQPCLVPVEKEMNSAGYRLQNENGMIAFDWY
ncbi:MAG: hypothetical protein EOO69_04645 [Moraxellaceae bacterium]|nr:MAG: hypothetical protein EOO69_04645 [Moraxellaceae bacterium]